VARTRGAAVSGTGGSVDPVVGATVRVGPVATEGDVVVVEAVARAPGPRGLTVGDGVEVGGRSKAMTPTSPNIAAMLDAATPTRLRRAG
jgi:hypothetical protein